MPKGDELMSKGVLPSSDVEDLRHLQFVPGLRCPWILSAEPGFSFPDKEEAMQFLRHFCDLEKGELWYRSCPSQLSAVERSELFIRRTEALASRSLLQAIFSGIQTRVVEHGETFRLDSTLPDEEAQLALLVTFRLFLHKREPIYIKKVSSHAFDSIKSPRIRGRVTSIQEELDRLEVEWPVKLPVGGEHCGAAECLKLWMNGYIFHNDDKKLLKLDGLDESLRNTLIAQSLMYVSVASEQMFKLSKLLKRAIRQNIFTA